MKNRILYALAWTFMTMAIACSILFMLLWNFGNAWLVEDAYILFPILLETLFLSLLTATVFALIDHLKNYGSTLFDMIYKACLSFGLIIPIVITRDILASGFPSIWGILDLPTNKEEWYVVYRIYDILLHLSCVALVVAFAIKFISLVYKKDRAEKKKRVFLMVGYIFFAISSLALVRMIDYTLGIPIFITLSIAFLFIQRRFVKGAQSPIVYSIITKEEFVDCISIVKKIKFGRKYLNEEQCALLEKLSENLPDDELETMQSIIKTYSKPVK